MCDRIDAYYSFKAADAAARLAGTGEYEDARRRVIDLGRKLSSALSDGQSETYMELDAAEGEKESLTADAAYKAGFLEGYAAGRVVSRSGVTGEEGRL
jgi:hypothetical protein